MRADSLDPLKEKFGADCVFGVSASELTTYRAGGRLEAVVSPANREDLAWLLRFCGGRGLPFRVLGAGSNVLISDKGLPGVTAPLLKMNKTALSGDLLSAEAGALWDELARLSAAAGLAGMEKTSGIPGTVGGALAINAGAFGQEAFDRLERLEVMDGAGAVKTLRREEVKAGYRRVRGLEGLAVLAAVFRLAPGDKTELESERARVLARRAEKQPLSLPSAGSVFRRPPGDYASRLIDAAGLKGLRVGGAQVSEKHAGFIVNAGGASASDIYALMRKISAAVKASAGVELELEQVLLGEFE